MLDGMDESDSTSSSADSIDDSDGDPNYKSVSSSSSTSDQADSDIDDPAVAPDRDDAVAPDRDDAVAPDRDDAVAPDRDDAVALDRDDAVAPDRDDAVAPDRDDAVAPDRDDAVAPDRDEHCTRKRRSNPIKWKKNVTKKAKGAGKAYIDSRGNEKRMKVPQPSDCRTCRYKCNVNFTEEDRGKLCSEYWKLGDYARQKDFILSNVDRFDVQRQRTRGERKRTKTQSVVYSFKKGSEVVRVCKRFFLKTIDISHGPLITALKGRGEAGPFVGEDRRGRHTPANKASDGVIQRVKTHIESFPQIESHYTRSGSRRCYLDQKLSINKMYRLYKVECEKEDPPVAPVGAMTYRRIFCNGYNLSFFRPRKDQCSKCSKFKILEGGGKEAFRATYESHLRRKEEAQMAKAADKVRATEEKDTFVSAIFDLQSVLQIPSSDVSLFYYSRKLCVYNLCFYSSAPPNEAHCYCWSEVEGGRGSNEIGTCLFQWLSQLPPTVKEVSFYSDTCGGQNRNQNVAALLMYAVQKTQVETITHNFLESGHSYM